MKKVVSVNKMKKLRSLNRDDEGNEKDFDVVVPEAHFYDILLMNEEIEAKFGWIVDKSRIPLQRLFLKILPLSMFKNEKQFHRRNRDAYQIDVYGFRINQTMINFPWQNMQVSTELFLPLLKYKQTAPSSGDHSNDHHLTSDRNTLLQAHHFYMPFKTQCILRNMYGPDYMTPKSFEEDGKRTWTLNQFVNDTSLCKEGSMSDTYQSKLERQKAWFSDEKLIASKNKKYLRWMYRKRRMRRKKKRLAAKRQRYWKDQKAY